MKKYIFPGQDEGMLPADLCTTPERAAYAIMPYRKAQSIYLNGTTWYVVDNSIPTPDGAHSAYLNHTPGPDVAITAGWYIPSCVCSGISVDCYPETGTPADSYLLHFDLECSFNHIDRFIPGQRYPGRITRVYLDAGTTATKIVFYRT